jgi:hypothetical protein
VVDLLKLVLEEFCQEVDFCFKGDQTINIGEREQLAVVLFTKVEMRFKRVKLLLELIDHTHHLLIRHTLLFLGGFVCLHFAVRKFPVLFRRLF